MKILVIHASAGAGHLKAAEAIHEAIEKHTSHQSIYVDALDYTSPIFKKMYRDFYAFLVSKMPVIWKTAFHFLDLPAIQPWLRILRRIYNNINSRKLQKFLKEEQFDYIFSTQFFSTEIISAMKCSQQITSQLITVVTDFDVHHIWLADGVDQYAVASDWTAQKMQILGVPKEKIHVTGIPISEAFSVTEDIPILKKRLRLKENLFTILMATGSFGIGPIEEILKVLVDGFQVIVICGHNKNLFQKLKSYQSEHVKILGLVDNMPELMAVSDVMLTKPGGLSISEALVSQLPMIFFNAIPGQEENNIKVLKTYGIGMRGYTIDAIVQELKVLRDSRDIYFTALKKTRVLARPTSAKNVIALIK